MRNNIPGILPAPTSEGAQQPTSEGAQRPNSEGGHQATAEDTDVTPNSEGAQQAAADEADERLGEFSSDPLPMATSDRMDRAATER